MRTIYLLLKGIFGYLKRSLGHLTTQRKKYTTIGIPLGEVLRLRSSPYQLNTETILFNKRININSPYWYLHGLKEIFFDESYLFTSKNPEPFIVDCGANIGVSVIFFKKNYPASKIIAFEPDPEIFKLLKQNVSAFKFEDVELNQKAVWNEEKQISFASDGGVGGTIIQENDTSKNQTVDAIRLRSLLENKKVDFLKIDIEGAEYEVLKDCRDVLRNVDNLFVEYHSVSDSDQKLDEILNILKQAGFRIYIKEAWVIKERPFVNEPAAAFDLQLNIFGYKK